MARRPNYGYEKRQRELKKQKKKEAKAERKRLKKEEAAAAAMFDADGNPIAPADGVEDPDRQDEDPVAGEESLAPPP